MWVKKQLLCSLHTHQAQVTPGGDEAAGPVTELAAESWKYSVRENRLSCFSAEGRDRVH